MNSRVLLVVLAVLLGIVLVPLGQAVEFRIESPDKGEVWPKSVLKDRSLSWDKKKQRLVAEVTFTDELYSSGGSSTEVDTLQFVIPQVSLDEASGIFYATAPTGERVPVAQWSKRGIGQRIELYRTALLRVARFRKEVTVTMDVNSRVPFETPKEKVNEDGTVSLPLNSVIGQ